MLSTVERGVSVARAVLAEARRQQITFLAASIAYYAFVSMLPILLLVLAVSSFVGGEAFALRVVGTVRGLLTPQGEGVLAEILRNPEGRGGATVLGVVVLLWSTLKVFRGVDEAFSRVYDVDDEEPFLETVTDALVALVVIAATVGGIVLVNVALSTLKWLPFANLLGGLVLFVGLVPAFLPLYYFFPDVDIPLREALPGAIVATVGWTTLQVAFSIYADNAGQYAAYGVLAGALLLVTWLYAASIVVLLGAVVNVVLAERGAFRKTKDAGGDKERQQEYRGEHVTDDTDRSAPNILELREDLRRLQTEVEEFERDVDERTVEKPELESELKRYVRRRMRRGHARGWGPYLVLLYGTAMTLGAFYFLEGGWAIAAMVVVWLSTLGLYSLMVLVGFGVSAVGLPGRVAGRVRDWRS